jgi:formylglycine-generating enzyme required for sulfatase activity
MRDNKQVLRDLRARNGEFPQCVSPFGVLNLVGNLDEPVLREGAIYPSIQTALKGGWWMPARNRCRAATTAHDADYRDVQIGARCCADIADTR